MATFEPDLRSVRERIRQFLYMKQMQSYADLLRDYDKGVLRKFTYQMRGDSALSIDMLLLLKTIYPDLDLNWIITGKGAALGQDAAHQRDEQRVVEEDEKITSDLPPEKWPLSAQLRVAELTNERDWLRETVNKLTRMLHAK